MQKMKKFEKSAKDMRKDSRKGAPKEGSKKDMAMDRKAMRAPAFKRGGAVKRGC